jgi:hypothetical protein
MNRRASVFQNVGEYFLGHSVSAGLSTDAVHGLQELSDVDLANAVVFFGRHNHSDITILAANQYRFALGRVEKSGEALFRIGRCDGLHLSIIDNIDKSNKSASSVRRRRWLPGACGASCIHRRFPSGNSDLGRRAFRSG